jgi:hypothetical protein
VTRRPALLLLALAAIAAPAPAEAAPVIAVAKVAASFIAGSAVAQSLLQLGLGLALSSLQRARMKQPDRPGIKIEQTLVGDTQAEAFGLGRFATGGVFAGPHRTHGDRNEYLTMVIDLGGVPGMALEEVFVNGERRPLLWSAPHPDYGVPVDLEGDLETRDVWEFDPDWDGVGLPLREASESARNSLLWVKFLDGSQTAADPMLRDRYGSDPDYPWTADMIGRGRCFAIVTVKGDDERMTSLPQLRFGMRGVPLYDPRRDGTAGGTGTQRANDPATWAWTENPAVMVYNLLRGIPVGEERYGGRADEADLPADVWFAAMNEADVLVEERAGGGTREVAQYRAGTEVLVDEPPADVIERLLRTCSGALAEVGGAYVCRIGAPAMPVHWITDDDLVIDRASSLDPFPGLAETINGLAATYPDPATAWEMREAPPVVRSDLEAVDDARRLRQTLAFEALPYGAQVQRVAKAYVEDSRRFRRHVLTLPPDAAHLRLLDVLAWTSARNGYDGKLFEVAEAALDLHGMLPRLTLREVDPADNDWDVAFEAEAPAPPLGRGRPTIAAPAFDLYAIALTDGAGAARRPALLVEFEPGEKGPVDLEMRHSVTGQPAGWWSGVKPVAGSHVVTEGLLPGETFGVRARYTPAGARTLWSAWQDVTAADLRLGWDDLGDDFAEYVRVARERHDVAIEDATGTVADLRDQLRAEIAAVESGGALATRVDVLEAEMDDAEASVTSEAAARASADGALSGRIDTVTSRVGSAEASIGSLAATRVTSSGAVAAVEDRIDASFGSLAAMASATATAKATSDRIQATYVLRLNGQNVFEASRVSDNSGASSTVKLKADLIDLDGKVGIGREIGSTDGRWFINGDGRSRFTDVTVDRNLLIDSGLITIGDFNTSRTGDLNHGYAHPEWAEVGRTQWFVHTDVHIDAWQGARRVYAATVEHDRGSVSAKNASAADTQTYWGWTADVLPLTFWDSSKSPFQRLRLRIRFWSRNVDFVDNCRVRWKLFEVS